MAGGPQHHHVLPDVPFAAQTSAADVQAAVRTAAAAAEVADAAADLAAAAAAAGWAADGSPLVAAAAAGLSAALHEWVALAGGLGREQAALLQAPGGRLKHLDHGLWPAAAPGPEAFAAEAAAEALQRRRQVAGHAAGEHHLRAPGHVLGHGWADSPLLICHLRLSQQLRPQPSATSFPARARLLEVCSSSEWAGLSARRSGAPPAALVLAAVTGAGAGALAQAGGCAGRQEALCHSAAVPESAGSHPAIAGALTDETPPRDAFPPAQSSSSHGSLAPWQHSQWQQDV